MKKIELLIKESISLELNVSELYMLFYKRFSEDQSFWWQMALEEKNHASLIKGAKQVLLLEDELHNDLFYPDTGLLAEMNSLIESYLVSFNDTPPSRETAFNIALELELSAGELHFQSVLDKNSDDHIVRILKTLNKEDKNHAKRIQEYMESNAIPIASNLKTP